MDHEKQTVGDIKQWGASEGCPAWEYMIINMFYKTLPSSWKIDWNKARDGVGSQVFYLYGFFLVSVLPS